MFFSDYVQSSYFDPKLFVNWNDAINFPLWKEHALKACLRNIMFRVCSLRITWWGVVGVFDMEKARNGNLYKGKLTLQVLVIKSARCI